MKHNLALFLAALTTLLVPSLAAASEVVHIDGSTLGLPWALPFVGMLLSIAVLPLAAPHLWHHHFGKISAIWSALVLVPAAIVFGVGAAFGVLAHTIVLEYVPFLILIGTLFTIAGGVLVRGNLHGDPKTNAVLLMIGTVLASVMGTTGAAMLLVRPIIRANDGRLHNAHVLVFFTFLVANIGGALTPLGDPPLFLGFLKGVAFFWPTVHLLAPTLVAIVVVLGVFVAIDSMFYSRDSAFRPHADPTPDSPIRLEGTLNFALLGGVVLAVLVSGMWHPGVHWSVAGIEIELQNVVRDLALVGLAALSLTLTPNAVRSENGFSWGPIQEVAILFAGIFVTMIPALTILRAGLDGALAPVVGLVTDANGQPIDAAYFWLTGGLSSFLDNAPTYLVFFNTAGGDAHHLMHDVPQTLAAISAGAVFMGANSYIGNAPNFMVKSIAEEQGIAMPSFFGYMAWSIGVLIPTFLLITWLFFL